MRWRGRYLNEASEDGAEADELSTSWTPPPTNDFPGPVPSTLTIIQSANKCEAPEPTDESNKYVENNDLL